MCISKDTAQFNLHVCQCDQAHSCALMGGAEYGLGTHRRCVSIVSSCRLASRRTALRHCKGISVTLHSIAWGIALGLRGSVSPLQGWGGGGSINQGVALGYRVTRRWRWRLMVAPLGPYPVLPVSLMLLFDVIPCVAQALS